MAQSAPSQILSFANFAIDLRSGEIRKSGIKIKLQEKPFQILVLLLDRPGELVSREELRGKLWPEGTFVDFDHSLGTAIAKLRQALGDSAQNPRFIETVSNRGYRFLVPVENRALAPAPPLERALSSQTRRFGSAAAAGLLGGTLVVAAFLGFNIADSRQWLRRQSNPRSVRKPDLLETSGLTARVSAGRNTT